MEGVIIKTFWHAEIGPLGNLHMRGIPSKRKPNTRRPLFRPIRGYWMKGKFYTIKQMDRMVYEHIKKNLEVDVKNIWLGNGA